MDNSAARQLALRQGVGNKTRHVAGRLLWLQQAVREKLLTVSAIASACNLGDLSTKMHPANRLKCLLFLHGCADCDTAQSIGSSEFEKMVMKETIKAQVKRVRMEYAREHGCSPHFSGGVNRLAKQIAMMTLFAMPQYSEAADDGGRISPRMGVDFNSIVELTTADVGSSMLTVSAEQWAIVMLLYFILKMRHVHASECDVRSSSHVSGCAGGEQASSSVSSSSCSASAGIPSSVIYCSERGDCRTALPADLLYRSSIKRYSVDALGAGLLTASVAAASNTGFRLEESSPAVRRPAAAQLVRCYSPDCLDRLEVSSPDVPRLVAPEGAVAITSSITLAVQDESQKTQAIERGWLTPELAWNYLQWDNKEQKHFVNEENDPIPY
eukprot:s5299_g3.t2